jgi:hypothetical protein
MGDELGLPEVPASLDVLAAFLLEIDAPLPAGQLDGMSLQDADWRPSLQNGLLGDSLFLSGGANDTEASEEDATPPSPRDGVLVSRQRAYRERKKATRCELHALAAALAVQLVALQSRGVQATGTVSGWRGVALRQLKRRQETEGLNRMLRAQIRHHRGLALQLVETLRSRVSALPSTRSLELLSARPRKPVMVLDDAERSLIETLRGELAGMYVCADEILGASAMPQLGPGMDHSTRHGHQRDYHSGTKYVEFAEAQAVPFGLSDAVYAMHKATPILLGKECEPVVVAFPESPFEFAAKFQFTSAVNAAVQYESMFVSKAVEDKGRWLFVWRGRSREISATTPHASPSSSTGAIFLDEGWGTAREFPGGSDDQSTGTILEFYSRTRSVHSSPSVPTSARLDEYLREIVTSAANEAAKLSQAMENVLVDDMAALSISRRAETGFPLVNGNDAAL